MPNQVIDGRKLRDMILLGVSLLSQSKASIDALNVFPVPDGDTGTNMSMTMLSAAKEIAAVDSASVHDVAEALVRGSLRGARGNSGVILSQIWRGFARAIDGNAEMDAALFAEALRQGSETAYKAVMKPREGTILTIQRAVGDEAVSTLTTTQDIAVMMDAVMAAGEAMLRRTPDMLPVLKQAGVVDAGGKGLLVILAGMRAALKGEQIDAEALVAGLGSADLSGITDEEEDSKFTYCTEIIIEHMHEHVRAEDIEALRAKLSLIGDCVLVVGDIALVKVHVHTDSPGRVLSEGLKLGELTNIKIDNMHQQHRTLIEAPASAEKKDYAIVSVAVGEGIKNIFIDLGASEIVNGGQTMNPSIDDIAQAVKRANAKTVFILPNNPNIILAAQQAAQIEGPGVFVIPTKSVPQGISALVAFMASSTPEENTQRMMTASEGVRSGAVSFAVRETTWKGQTISQGDILGLFDGDIAIVGKEVAQVTSDLVAAMHTDEHSVISLFYGEDVSEEDARAMSDSLSEAFPDDDVEVKQGGQSLYYYLISIE